MRLKGNPNANQLALATLGVPLEEAIDAEWRKQVWQLLEQYYITDL